MDRFTATLKQLGADQLSVEYKRLFFEREKLEEETRRYQQQRDDWLEDAEKKYAECKEEQESQDGIELENSKVMMVILRQNKWNEHPSL